MPRGTIGAALLLAAGAAAAAPPQDPAPKPAPANTAAAPRPPLDLETAGRLLGRGEANLRLHGLSLDPRYLSRALVDFRAVARRLPEAADDEMRFRAWFDLGFAISRTDLERVPEGIADPAREGLDALAEARKIHPEFPGIPIASGMIRKQRGEPVEAMAEISAGLESTEGWRYLTPDAERELLLLAMLARAQAVLQSGQAKEHLALQDVETASALAEDALRDPRTPPGNGLRRVVLTHLAAVYQRLDQFENAAKVLGWLMEDDPGNAMHAYHFALIQANLKRYEAATDSYRRAALLDPSDPRPHIKVAYILLLYSQGAIDLDGASREAEVYLSLRRGAADAEYCALRSQIAKLREDLREAEQWARRALLRDPLCRTALSILVGILGSREDVDSAAVRREIEDLRRSLEESQKRNAGGSDRTFC